MRETPDDLRRLGELLRSSSERAGDFLRSSFGIPEHSLSAAQLVRHLDGARTVALATVTSTSLPRVAPVLAFFYRAAFHIPTVRDALRTRHVLRNPGVSLNDYEDNDFAVIVHGTAEIVDDTSPHFDKLVELQLAFTRGDVREWGDAVYLRVDPTHIFTFARYPEQFPE